MSDTHDFGQAPDALSNLVHGTLGIPPGSPIPLPDPDTLVLLTDGLTWDELCARPIYQQGAQDSRRFQMIITKKPAGWTPYQIIHRNIRAQMLGDFLRNQGISPDNSNELTFWEFWEADDLASYPDGDRAPARYHCYRWINSNV